MNKANSSLFLEKATLKTESKREMGTFPNDYMGLFKTLSSGFPKVLGVSTCEIWTDEHIGLIALIQRFPGLERD
jgi:hypothetical protein